MKARIAPSSLPSISDETLPHTRADKEAPQDTATQDPLDLWASDKEAFSSRPLGSAVLDIHSDISFIQEVRCLIVAYEEQWCIEHMIREEARDERVWRILSGLLLVLAGEEQGTYRRVGHSHLYPDREHLLIDSAEKKTLFLI